jgi:uncharacterized membrane protein (UPF0127 family)
MKDTRFLRVSHADGVPLPLKVRRCDTFLCRLRGLMFRRRLAVYEGGLHEGALHEGGLHEAGLHEAGLHEGLLFMEARESQVATSIHMFFVFFSIGVVWMDADWGVVDKVLAKPFRPYYAPQAPAQYFLEGPPDLLTWVEVGERLRMEPW